MPVGILNAGMPPDIDPCRGGDCGCVTVISLVGLMNLRAVTGVVPAVVTEEGVEPA